MSSDGVNPIPQGRRKSVGSGVSLTTTGFDGLLSASDTDVQAALDTVDDDAVGGRANLTNATRLPEVSASGTLSESALAESISGGTVTFSGTVTANRTFTVPDGDGTLLVGGAPIDSVAFNTAASAPAHSEGIIFWDDDAGTLAAHTNITDVTLQLGQEFQWARVCNNTGIALSNGTVVMLDGYDAVNDCWNIKKASALDANRLQRDSIGILTHDAAAAAGTPVRITRLGVVNDLDTSGDVAGGLIYLSETAGEYTQTRPNFPAAVVVLGAIGKSDASTGNLAVDIREDTNDSGFDGCIIERHDLTIVEDTGSLYFEVEKAGGGDVPFQIGGQVWELDATTGSGTGGKARSNALTPGTSTATQENFCYIEVVAGTPTLKAATSLPDSASTPHARAGEAEIWSVAKHGTDGPALFQRWTDAIAHNNRGRESYTGERIRAFGATYQSGVAPSVVITTNGGAADNVVFSNASGGVYQFHLQTFPALDISTDGVYVANASGAGTLTKYQKITDLNQILEDSTGAAITNNDRFTLVIFGCANKDTGDCKLFVNLPSGTYSSDSNGYTDPNNFSVVSVPAELRETAFLIGAIPLRYTTSSSGTWTLLGTSLGRPDIIDLRGVPVGISGSASGGQASSFSDDVFSVFDNADNTKVVAFECSGITTGTTRTLTIPDASGTMLLEGQPIGATTPAAGDFTTLDASVGITATSAADTVIKSSNSASSADTVLASLATGAGFVGTQTAHNLQFATNNIPRMEINTSGEVTIGTDPGGTDAFRVGGALTINASTMITTKTSFTNGAGANTGTLTNAPTAGDPTKWIPIDDNGTTRYIPAW